jgi:hypothetical protein
MTPTVRKATPQRRFLLSVVVKVIALSCPTEGTSRSYTHRPDHRPSSSNMPTSTARSTRSSSQSIRSSAKARSQGIARVLGCRFRYEPTSSGRIRMRICDGQSHQVAGRSAA